MKRVWLAAALAWLFVGCSEEPRPAAEEPTPAGQASGEVDAAAVEASKVQLPEAEIKALAETQKVCAVTGEPLGSMGAPEPVALTDSKGDKHTVLICCEHCREELLKDPDKYLAQLDQAKAAPAPEGDSAQE
jgi:hypothetical protein